jgi:hypothetical protein
MPRFISVAAKRGRLGISRTRPVHRAESCGNRSKNPLRPRIDSSSGRGAASPDGPAQCGGGDGGDIRPGHLDAVPARWPAARAPFTGRPSRRRRILRLRSGWQPLRAARPDHPRQCRPVGPGLDLPYRRSQKPRLRRAQALEIRGHADPGWRQAGRLHAVQRRGGARPRHGARAVALRP